MKEVKCHPLIKGYGLSEKENERNIKDCLHPENPGKEVKIRQKTKGTGPLSKKQASHKTKIKEKKHCQGRANHEVQTVN